LLHQLVDVIVCHVLLRRHIRRSTLTYRAPLTGAVPSRKPTEWRFTACRRPDWSLRLLIGLGVHLKQALPHPVDATPQGMTEHRWPRVAGSPDPECRAQSAAYVLGISSDADRWM